MVVAMTTLVNILLLIAVLVVPGSALCNFPCIWIGKTFILEDQQDIISSASITFSKRNRTEAAVTVDSVPVDLTCLKINGPYIWLKWTTPEGSFSNCLTVKIVSPDVFTFIFRDVVESGGFCDACFEANDANSALGVARANGAKDAVGILSCKGPPKSCAKVCYGLRRLKECRRPGHYQSRFQKPSHYYRKTKPFKK